MVGGACFGRERCEGERQTGGPKRRELLLKSHRKEESVGMRRRSEAKIDFTRLHLNIMDVDPI